MFEQLISGMFHLVDSILSLFGNIFSQKSITNQLTGSYMLLISTERYF